MNPKSLLSIAIALSFALLAQAASLDRKAPLNVRDFGATGDGKTKDTAAFQKALDACAFAGSGEVVVPPGNYLIGGIHLSSYTTLRIEKDATLTGSPDKDDYPLMDVRWEGRWRQGHRALICANHAQHIALLGHGTIVGDPALAFLRDPRGPALFEPIDCKDLRIEDLSFKYGRMWCIHLTYCENVLARNLNIRSDKTKSNGDGIDIDSCRNVRVEKCDIDTGDDAIAIKSGRGMEAVRIARPCEDITIVDSSLGSAFAGVGIGTEMSGGVRNVRVERCSFPSGANAFFFKSRIGRGGFIENVSAKDLDIGTTTFIGIDLLTKGIQDSEPVPGDNGIPRVNKINISKAKVHCKNLVVGANVPSEKPIDGFSLSDITGTCQKGITLANVIDAKLRGINVTGFSGPLLTINNVTGTGLENAVHGQATNAPANRPAQAP